LNCHLYGALLLAGLLAGCSTVKTYPDALPRNVHIHTETSSGALLSKVRAAVHIHRVDANCLTEYEGTLRLDQGSVELGIPAGRTSVVAVTFSSSSVLGGSSSSVRYATLLTPRSDHKYDLKVSYREDIYDVTIREIDPRRSSSREIERRDPAACKAL
jgi:hypothetical protein